MHKLVFTLAVAGSVLVFASPAAAQYYPRQQSYGYGYDNNNYAARVHEIGRRIERLNRQIQGLGRADIIDARQERSLSLESRDLGYQLQAASRNGFDFREQQFIEARLANLEQRVQSVSAYGNGARYNGYNGYNGSQYRDRNRDRGEHRYERNREHRDGDRDDD